MGTPIQFGKLSVPILGQPSVRATSINQEFAWQTKSADQPLGKNYIIPRKMGIGSGLMQPNGRIRFKTPIEGRIRVKLESKME